MSKGLNSDEIEACLLESDSGSDFSFSESESEVTSESMSQQIPLKRKKGEEKYPSCLYPLTLFKGERGSLVWAKMRGSPWWPGLLVNADDCGQNEPQEEFAWVFWLKDNRVSQITAYRVGQDIDRWLNRKLLTWAENGFHVTKQGNFTNRITIYKKDPTLFPDFVTPHLEKLKNMRKGGANDKKRAPHSSSTEVQKDPTLLPEKLKNMRMGRAKDKKRPAVTSSTKGMMVIIICDTFLILRTKVIVQYVVLLDDSICVETMNVIEATACHALMCLLHQVLANGLKMKSLGVVSTVK
ncbi:hypothetical protein C0J52_01432 [Blattella germanica]|nr:hypothetical protein C0J52_01432 [Blattella germanica]